MIVLNSLLMALECFFGGTVVLALALLLSHGKAASQRHLIVSVGFAVLLLLPLASLLLPSHMVWQLAAAPVQTQMVPVAAPPAAPGFDWSLVVAGLVALWAMGVIFVLSKAACGGVALAALYRSSVPHIPEGLSGDKFRGLRWQLRIRTTPGDAGPITWGILRPVVLLPKSSVSWSRARLEAVLLHEAAHVRRQDCLTRLIALVACAFYWPNPLVWVAASIMRRDGETAADDVVLMHGIKASAYAEHLVGLAQAFAVSRPSYAGVSLAMAERAMLDARVEAILNPTRKRQAIGKADVLKIGLLGLTATAVIALVRPSLAEAPAEVPPVREIQITAHKVLIKTKSKDKTGQIIVRAESDEDESAQDEDKAAQDEDNDPPETPAAPVPPAPPAPPAAPASLVPPAPPAHSHFTMHWKTSDGIDKSWEGSGAAEQAEADRALATAKAEYDQRRAEHDRARAEARAAFRRAPVTVKMNLSDVMAEHKDEMAQARVEIAKARESIRVALANAQISQTVAKAFDKAVTKALKDAEPKIKEALAKTKVDVHVKIDNDDED